MSANPVQGNQTFNTKNIATEQIQRLKADTVNASNYIAGIVATAPTGPTGPLNNIPQIGQIVYAATGALGSGAGAGLYVYTGEPRGWLHTNLTNA